MLIAYLTGMVYIYHIYVTDCNIHMLIVIYLAGRYTELPSEMARIRAGLTLRLEIQLRSPS